MEREKEIKNFKAEEYYRVVALLHTDNAAQPIRAELNKRLPSKEAAMEFLESAVEHTARLLGVHTVDVDAARRLDGVKDCAFGDFVKYDAFCLFRRQTEHLVQVPSDGFSLAVLIGSQPDLLGFLRSCFQFCNELFLFIRNLIVWFHGLLVYTKFLLFQVTNVAVRRHHLIVFT